VLGRERQEPGEKLIASFKRAEKGIVNFLGGLQGHWRVGRNQGRDTALPTTKYKNHRFPVEIISHAVWLYFRFCLSFRNVEELLLERGVIVTYEPVMRLGLTTPDEKKAAQGYTDPGSGVPEVERPWCLQPVYEPDPRTVFRHHTMLPPPR
jgi:hypothetical protein